MTEAERIELMKKVGYAAIYIGEGHYLLAEVTLSAVMAKLAPVSAAQVKARHAELQRKAHDAA